MVNDATCVCIATQSCPTLFDTMDCASQAPLSMEFSRQEYWSGLSFPSPRIFLTQGLRLGLLHCGKIRYCLSHQGSPRLVVSIWI